MTAVPRFKKNASLIRCVVFLFLLCLSHWSSRMLLADARDVRVGVYENQPKIFTEADGTPAGIFVDLIEEIARREAWTLHYVHGSWAECLERLEAGEIDLMMDVAYSPERAEIYTFCEDDVICNWAQVYTRKGLNIKLITDLKDLRVVTMRKGIHLERLKNLADGFGFSYDLTLVEDYESVFRTLQEKKADAGIVNRVYGYTHETEFDVTRSPVVFSPASLRFAVKKGVNRDLITAIDSQLADMKAEKGSAYHQALRRWLGETTQLSLPSWIGWAFSAAITGLFLLFAMSILLKYEVNKKTAHLSLANAQLEKQVSETMKAHLKLKRSEELLVRQERLGALGQLTSGISHDFNNMLFPILGYSDLLLHNPELMNDLQKTLPMIDAIRTAANTSREIIKRLQEFQRADSRPKMESVNIAKLVSEVVEATKPLWKSQREAQSIPVKIIEDVPQDLSVTLSKAQFSEALMNLLLNALHAIAGGGQVTIRAFVEDEHFNLQVEDTGAGMSSEVACKCLEPFFSTKGEEGTGMGLAMVHGIVRRHNGTLNINSVPGNGTTITMQIPLAQNDIGMQSAQETSSQTIRVLKVLVVDDDESIRKLLSEYLILDGHSAATAVDTADGIEKFNQDAFDLVITDRAMPKGSGDELAQYIKDSGRSVPVIMITGFAQIMASHGEHPVGVDCVIGKPFTIEELRETIGRTIRDRVADHSNAGSSTNDA
ncbi:transporter substrate-binding domain-containing protein [Candidatus Sumerlaeota bacterium]|nr:transporter substrate-binding domain-containing protein [Candidatus Sumerlaeota bacterium]